MFSKFVLTQLVCFFTLLVGVFAAPGSLEALEKRDVFVPPVLYPHAGTVWTKGQRHNVTWCVHLLSSFRRNEDARG